MDEKQKKKIDADLKDVKKLREKYVKLFEAASKAVRKDISLGDLARILLEE